mmetsp:Transcript_39501/g.77728  ORF Transcript_39501/g.77728 Transcript_39501/m.77728 type:complete len:180 (+) Transcript_39501:2329-2868(+)
MGPCRERLDRSTGGSDCGGMQQRNPQNKLSDSLSCFLSLCVRERSNSSPSLLCTKSVGQAPRLPSMQSCNNQQRGERERQRAEYQSGAHMSTRLSVFVCPIEKGSGDSFFRLCLFLVASLEADPSTLRESIPSYRKADQTIGRKSFFSFISKKPAKQSADLARTDRRAQRRKVHSGKEQ